MSAVAFVRALVGALWRERRHDAAQLEAVQRRRLGALLAHARARTALGRARLSDVDPNDPDLSRVPPIEKAELMARFDDSIADGAITLEAVRRFTAARDRVGDALDGRFVCATTSGTTGRPGYFVTDREAWGALNGALLARILRHRLIPREVLRFSPLRRYRMAMTVATGGHYITKLVSTFQPTLARGLMTMRTFSIACPVICDTM